MSFNPDIKDRPDFDLDYEAGGDQESLPEQSDLISLDCPNCKAQCTVDPTEFPQGQTVAACSACGGQLIIEKAPSGALSLAISQDKAIDPDFMPGPIGPRRQVICPKCLGRYRVLISKIPNSGAWVSCPSCHERFMVHPLEAPLLEDPAPRAKNPKASHASASLSKSKPLAKGLGHYLYRTGPSSRDLDVTMLDPVSPKARLMWKVGVATLLLAAFVSVLVVLTTSWKSAKTLTVAEITVPVRVPQYGLENFASDLRALQSFMSKTKFIDQKVAYTGEQSRVFKFAVATLAPETCTAITSLAVKSYDPSMGFTLKATCLVSSEKAASLEILWKGRYAELFLTGRDRSERLSVMIHPPKGTGATEPGQQTQPAQPDYNMGPLDGQPAINI